MGNNSPKQTISISKPSEFKTNLKEVFAILLPLIFLWIIEYFFVGINFNYWIPSVSTEGIFIEFIILYALCLTLFGIVRKWKIVIIVSAISLLLLGIINQVKFAFTNEPVLLSDLLFLNSTSDLLSIIQSDFWNTISWFILPTIIEITLISLLTWYGAKLSKNFVIKSQKIRFWTSATSLIILLFFTMPIQPFNELILNTVYSAGNRKDYARFTENSDYYIAYGILGGIYNRFLEDRIMQPDEYNEEKVLEELANAKGAKKSIFGTPNIIVIFSESFWDISKLQDVKFNKDITPNLNQLKKEGLSFNMITPSYGGVSANVEYEFLTGNNTMYYNHNFIPYMQLYNNDSYFNRPSIINELKNNNYKTKIVTASSPSLFSCGRFYNYLNLDEVEYIENVANNNIAGLYVSDEYLTNKIIDYFNNKNSTEKIFYMTLTMESHMPYLPNKYDSYSVSIVDSNYSDETNDTLTAYAQGIYDADIQLGKLYKYIKEFNEPTILVFFGDHLPYLYSGKENAINTINYFNTDDDILNKYRKYNTESLIVSNFDLNLEDADVPNYLGPDTLGAYILNNMDIDIIDYYKWLYDSAKILPTANYAVSTDTNGNIYNTPILTGRLKEIYNTRRDIEYKLFVK